MFPDLLCIMFPDKGKVFQMLSGDHFQPVMVNALVKKACVNLGNNDIPQSLDGGIAGGLNQKGMKDRKSVV